MISFITHTVKTKRFLRALMISGVPIISGIMLTPAAQAAEGDASNGANVFTGQCSICHSVKEGKNKIGPSLSGLAGRVAGSVSSFSYSDAMKNSGITWTKETLDKYLTNPSAMIPGIKMPYQGLADEKARIDLIEYLITQVKK